ncbi:MAG TPA: GlsB/YeaQ/YmgE family stress response membrane protein [Candidatus Saccharicenans sp.]|nr:GlsB/YeaQ/YmgE family stress response membrane protein [Candidatus Saccharicenans sp.]
MGQFLKIYEPGETAGFIGAIIGALIILFIISFFRKKAR